MSPHPFWVISKSLVSNPEFPSSSVGHHGCPGSEIPSPNPLPPANGPGSHHGRDRDSGLASVAAFGAHVSHLPGHAEEHNDHQGVPPQILL